MIDFKDYGIDYNEDDNFSITVNDLIAIANIEKVNIDSKVVRDDLTNTVEISGIYRDIEGKFIIIREEICKIISSEISDNNTIITLERGLFNTKKTVSVGFKARTVVIPTESEDIDLIDFSFEDSIGNVSNNLFPVEVSSGVVNMKSDLKLWSPTSILRKYRVRNRKSLVYLYKGVDEVHILKSVAVVTKLGVNSKGSKDPNRIKLEIKNLLAKWYDKDLAINSQLKSVTPREFFKSVFGLSDDEVYYSHNLDDSCFLPINNLHTKEYKKMNELLKAYCSNGVRFCFDRFERIKIFSDFKVKTLLPQKTIYTDLTESTLTEDDNMIYNTIDTQAVQRITLYNFEDLRNKYVDFSKVIRNITTTDKLITLKDGGIYMNTLEITEKEFIEHVKLGDLVWFKIPDKDNLEIVGEVRNITDKKADITLVLKSDKDYLLFTQGKGEYLFNILTSGKFPVDVYFVRNGLPMVWKLSKSSKDKDIDSNLMIPILPRVNGQTLYPTKYNAEFGSAQNIKYGTYTGIVEEVDKIYGTWDSSKLLYGREIDQFNNTIYPPIYALSNKVNEVLVGESHMIKYTTFNNENLLLTVSKPKESNKYDAEIIIENTTSVNKDIDLLIGQEISRVTNSILQVDDISNYHVGDVLIANKPDDLNVQEENEYNEVLSTIRWRITHKVTQVGVDGSVKNYIYLDSNYAKRKQKGKVYPFTKFPNTSIVYMQELYFRGNPVIELKQDVTGISKGTNYEGDRSTDLYGEKKYNFDSKQLSKDSMKMMMGYILDNFQAVDTKSTKFNLPVSVFNGIDIETLDIIEILDPLYTHIDEKNRWVVLSVNYKSKTNSVQIKAINVNNSDTKPFKLDVKDILEYKPVDIPSYSHTGNEGSDGSGTNDGQGGEGHNKALGIFNMSKVPTEKFRAKVDRFDANYIYFKDFAGEEWQTYVSKLFPVSEFGVSINGETMLVQSDREHRAYIKKRDIYDTGEQIIITPELDVSFLVMTSFTDIDGKFYSRSCHIGDGKNYFDFDIVKGAKFVGDFVIGENNRHTGNDLFQAIQKNRTFQLPEKPVNTPQYMLKEGDMWYDTDDKNHPYRYNGSVWVSARDGSIVSAHNSVFIQPNEPVGTEGKVLKEGDSWYDTDDGYKPYVYKDGRWNVVTDIGLKDIIEKVKQQAINNSEKLSDIANDNKLTPNEKIQLQLDIDSIKVEYPKYVNEGSKLGLDYTDYKRRYDDLTRYIDPLLIDKSVTNTIDRDTFKNKFNDYYVSRQDFINKISSKVKELADNAQRDATTALGNAKIFHRPTPPTEGMKENDMWINTANGMNEPFIYINGEWVSARDKIYETEGGNKVYFKDTQPPTSGKGVKEGDMWFDTSHNNTQYVLLKQPSGSLVWTLASDANDKIANGRIVLNGNTVVNGDFKVSGGNVELNASTKINGILEVFSNDKGIISYNGSSPETSTQRIVIKGGEILFQVRV